MYSMYITKRQSNVREIAAGVNPATPVYGINPDQNCIGDDESF